MNKELRKSLIGKYLNAETDAMQERMLARWFACHKADKDEETVAKLILAEHPEVLCDAAEVEYETIMATYSKRGRVRRFAVGFAACAAVIVGLLILIPERTETFDGLEMAYAIERIMELDMENVESVTALPKGDKVILTAVMSDRSECHYIMSKENGTETISITAMK